MIKNRIERARPVVVLLMLLGVSPAIAAESAERIVEEFQGYGPEQNLLFSVNGRWEIRWQSEGNRDFPSLSRFSAHLYDAASGEFLGVVAQQSGSGWGRRYIEEGGRYRINVLGRNVHWRIRIVDVAEPWTTLGPEWENAREAFRGTLVLRPSDRETE